MTRAATANRSSWHHRCHNKRMRHPLLKTFVLVCVVIVTAATAGARTFPIEKITRDNQEFFGTVSYDVEKAYAGNHNLELSVLINSRDSTRLELTGLDAPEQTKIEFERISDDRFLDDDCSLQATEYKSLVDIPGRTEPRIYLVAISFAFGDHKNIRRTFWLYAGVRNKGKLSVVTDSTSTTEFYTGSTNMYQLQLENNFPDYAVNVKSISVRSDARGLIDSKIVELS